jgi:hypothetical protein
LKLSFNSSSPRSQEVVVTAQLFSKYSTAGATAIEQPEESLGALTAYREPVPNEEVSKENKLMKNCLRWLKQA